MPTTCLVCDQPAYVWIGGAPLCRVHQAFVLGAIEELRAKGEPVSATKVALDLRKEAKELKKREKKEVSM